MKNLFTSKLSCWRSRFSLILDTLLCSLGQMFREILQNDSKTVALTNILILVVVGASNASITVVLL